MRRAAAGIMMLRTLVGAMRTQLQHRDDRERFALRTLVGAMRTPKPVNASTV